MHCILLVSNTTPCVHFCSCLSGLHEFDSQKNHEVNEFRAKMRSFCEEKAQDRQRLPWYQWMEYSFSCDLEPCVSLAEPGGIKTKGTKKIFVNVKFEASDVSALFLRSFLLLFLMFVLVNQSVTFCEFGKGHGILWLDWDVNIQLLSAMISFTGKFRISTNA